MMFYPYPGNAALDRQLFRYWEQLEDPDSSGNMGVEAILATGDAALDRQLFRYQEQPKDRS